MLVFIQILNYVRIGSALLWLFFGVFQPTVQGAQYYGTYGAMPSMSFMGEVMANGLGAFVVLFLHKLFPAVWEWLSAHPDILEYLGINFKPQPDTQKTIDELLAELDAALNRSDAAIVEQVAVRDKVAEAVKVFNARVGPPAIGTAPMLDKKASDPSA